MWVVLLHEASTFESVVDERLQIFWTQIHSNGKLPESLVCSVYALNHPHKTLKMCLNRVSTEFDELCDCA